MFNQGFGFTGGGGSGGGDVTQAELDAEISARESADTSLSNRTTILENNEFKITYFESVSGATGTVAKPATSTILLDQFASGVDAYVSTIVNGQPTGTFPQTSGGVAIDVTSFNASGDFVLSGTPSAYPVAIIYVIKITGANLANALVNNRVELEETQTDLSATASGTDTYTATITPSISSYQNTQRFFIKFTNANTGASTLNLNGLGAIAIKKGVSTALVSGDILAGQTLCIVYNGTEFQVIGGGSVTYGTTANTATQGNDTRVTNDEICISFDGQGSVIAVNTNAINPATSGGATITGWYIEGDVSGSITIDIKKNGTSMTGAGGNKPLLASAVTNNASVSGWTSTTYVVNDKLEVYVSVGAVSLTKCWLVLKTTITS